MVNPEINNYCPPIGPSRAYFYEKEMNKLIETKPTNFNKFVIISPFHNAGEWLSKHIESVVNQTYLKYRHILVDDYSNDSSENVARSMQHNKLGYIKLKSKQSALYGHITGISTYQIEPDEIIVHLDGDDWLADNNVLQYLNDIYNTSSCWVTYGNYKATDGSRSICKPITKETENFRERIVRGGWCYSHLRTFRKFLWDHIISVDLLDSNNNLFTSAPDVAIFCPILEMAGKEKIVFTDRENVIYNRNTQYNEDKIDLQDQIRCAIEISRKPPYIPITK